MGPLEQQLKALEQFKDWSNYMLVTTVAALGWVVSDDKGAVRPTSPLGRYTVIFLALSIIFAIFTLALIPVVAELAKGTGSFYNIRGRFRWIWVIGTDDERWVTLKTVCWPQHFFFIVGVVLYAVAAFTAPSSAIVDPPLGPEHGAQTMHCASGSICFELMKGVPAAIVALAIGILGAFIAYRQFSVARAKLKLALFDKRYTIFLDTWKIMSEVVMEGTRKRNYGLGNPFSNFMPQARFLFGRDVESYLSDAVTKWADLYALEAEGVDGANNVAEYAEKRRALTEWFLREASSGVKELFGRYLDFETWK